MGQPIFPGDSGVDQLVEIIKVLGTPTRDQIQQMNPNYTDFRFPQIRANPWQRVSITFCLFIVLWGDCCKGREERGREGPKMDTVTVGEKT